MKTNNQELFLEQEAENIQNMPLQQWRKTIAGQSIALFHHKGESIAAIETSEPKKAIEAEKLQQLSLQELRNLHKQVKDSSLTKLEEKAILTGL